MCIYRERKREVKAAGRESKILELLKIHDTLGMVLDTWKYLDVFLLGKV